MAKASARKLVGSLAILFFVFCYTLIAMWFGATVINAQPKWVHLVYYVLAGLAWTVPAYGLIRWMSKPSQ